ncbi:MAG: hypothetical protein CMJ19_11900 [Phycisphaeraceae bacterium]|nr:hypothetical protein [Phycisphaeraceae bacterium]|tara:strand:- start:55 stop:390 length:336 start_codon:yes stop_codon:yes gene_type:complete
MSQIGTGVAAGVAQTTYQAGDVNKRKTKEVRDKDRKTERLNDQFEQHMLALDEGDADGDQAPTQLRVNEQLPQHHTIQTEMKSYTHSTQQPPQAQQQPDDNEPKKHLDIQA